MSPFRNPAARALRARAQLLGPATTEGRIYRITRYPGLVAPGNSGEAVHGEVYRVPADHTFWKRMDLYEGPEYRRVAQTVTLEDGRTATAWTYRYVCGLAGRHRIPGGSFLSIPHSVWFAPRWSRRTRV